MNIPNPQFQSIIIKNNQNNEHKRLPECFCKGCDRTGINALKIILFNKVGYFCNECKTELLNLELVVDHE
ncbi:MAG TPA: hypothetical protein VF084_04455 [Nitrososphaeraceae archaeon]